MGTSSVPYVDPREASSRFDYICFLWFDLQRGLGLIGRGVTNSLAYFTALPFAAYAFSVSIARHDIAPHCPCGNHRLVVAVLTASQASRAGMFEDRVYDACCLNAMWMSRGSAPRGCYPHTRPCTYPFLHDNCHTTRTYEHSMIGACSGLSGANI
jgi:hypothetical protein